MSTVHVVNNDALPEVGRGLLGAAVIATALGVGITAGELPPNGSAQVIRSGRPSRRSS